jgi:type II secretory pathway component PulK
MSNFPESLNNCNGYSRRGIVLLVTLVLLVVLSTLAYTLSSRVSAQRHRDQYIIDYSKARYACDSAVKYALATLEDISPKLISRPDEPDFSDLFILSEADYRELLAQWAAKLQQGGVANTGMDFRNTGKKNLKAVTDTNDANDANDVAGGTRDVGDSNDANSLTIRGPYGPEWPFVTEPAEFEIGSATVRIEVEDENAKYPLGWALLGDQAVQREAQASFETFCEWMGFNAENIDSLKRELKKIGEVVKPFNIEFQSVTIPERTPPPPAPTPASRGAAASTRRTTRTSVTRKTVSAYDLLARQGADFAEVFHSSLIDTELLASPTIISENRKESALKYISMWGSTKVNINTAPRHVLEAAFTFGGDAEKIAREIIQRRRVKPFTNMEDLKTSLFRYTDSIRKCEKYITTGSNFFTIKVTVISGVAKASSVIAITKDGKTVRRIDVISS